MNTLGIRIRELRKDLNLNQTELSNALNQRYGLKTDRVMISKWETGFQTPVMSTISCIAKFFGVSIDYLNGDSNYTTWGNDIYAKFSTPEITDDCVTFPVIGEIAAGYDNNITMESWKGDTVRIPTEFLKGRDQSEFIVLNVKGDSMYPAYQEGDKVLILKQSTLNHSGQIGAVIYDECATLKRIEYVMGEDWMKLIPINPTHPPKTIRNEQLEHCKVIGIPKLLIREIEE